MNRARWALILGLVVAGGVVTQQQLAKSKPGHSAILARVMDRRCRGGCSASVAQLQILGSGPTSAQICAGTLTAQSGQAVSASRTASAYCTDASGVLHLLGANTVRVEPNGILVEGASTNNLLQSQNLANASWTPGATGSITSTTTAGAPDGTSTANVFTGLVTNGQKEVFQGVTTTAASWTFSVYLQAGSYTWAGLNWNNVKSVAVNLSNGTLVNPVGTTATSITPLANGWYRVSMTFTATAALTFFVVTFGDSQAHADSNGGNAPTFPGAGTAGVWGAQAEAQAFASSYIPTTTVTVARDADVVTVANPLPTNAPVYAIGFSVLTNVPSGTSIYAYTLGTNGLANSIVAGVFSGAPSATYRDGSNNFLQIAGFGTISPGVTGRVVEVNSSGTLTQYVGGVLGGSVTGTGTGAVALNSAIQIGGINLGGPNSPQGNCWLSRIYADTNPAKVPIN